MRTLVEEEVGRRQPVLHQPRRLPPQQLPLSQLRREARRDLLRLRQPLNAQLLPPMSVAWFVGPSARVQRSEERVQPWQESGGLQRSGAAMPTARL